MKKGVFSSIKTIAWAILLLVAVCPLANAKKPFVHPASKPKTDYLMVQSAQSANITYNTKTNTYSVILESVSPFVAFFSDRPDRTAGSMHIDEFLKLWEHKGKNSFWSNPPNADLHATQLQSSSEAVNFPVELTNPVYNAKDKTLSYTAKPLKGANVPPSSAKVQHVLLFIDDVCLSQIADLLQYAGSNQNKKLRNLGR